MKLYIHTCLICQKVFQSLRPESRYCCQGCSSAAYVQRRRERKERERKKECPSCGKQFQAKRRDAVHCSRACKQRMYRFRRP